MSENTEQRDVLIKVTVENNDAQKNTETLKKKFKELTDQALKFDDIDFDNASVGELRDHLNQANNVLKSLKDSGMASEQQLKNMGQTVNKLKSSLSSAKFDKAFKNLETSIGSVVAVAQLSEGIMKSMGIESEDAAKSIERMMALMSIKDGIEGLGKHVSGLKALVLGANSATSALGLMRIALASLGIGLVISAVTYLTENWEYLSNTVKEFIPELGGVGDTFKNIVPILEGVGKAVINFLVTPIRSAIQAFNSLKNGDWKGAASAISDAINPITRLGQAVKDFKSGMADGIMKKEVAENIKNTNAEISKSIALLEATGGKEKEIHALRVKQWKNEITQLRSKNKHLTSADKERISDLENNLQIEELKHGKFLKDLSDKANAERQKAIDKAKEDYKKLVEEVQGFIKVALKEIADSTRTERQRELNDLDLFYHEQIEKAKKANQDTAKLLEAKRIKEAEINKKFDKSDKEAELNKTKTIGETSILSASTNNSQTSANGLQQVADARLKSLASTFELEKQLNAENKEQLEFLEAQYANNVYNINKELADKKKALIDEERQKALDNAVLQGETGVLNTETNENPNTLSGIEALGNAKLEALRLQYEKERELYKDNKEQLAYLDAEYQANIKANDKETSDNKLALMDLNLSSASAVTSALGGLVEENSVMGKALAISTATIDTLSGGTKALSQGGFAGIAMMAATIASGLVTVKKIISTKIPTKNGGSKTGGFTAPQINTTQLTPRATQNVRVTENSAPQQQTIISKNYILNKDLETQKQKDEFLKSNSTI